MFKGHLKLAKEGYPLAECQVGYFYAEGIGVEKNLQKAFEWAKKAAEDGDRDAQCNLADTFYRLGQVVGKDMALATYWYQNAIDQGNDYALKRCQELGIKIK